MTEKVRIESTNVICSLGWDTAGVMDAVLSERGGIRICSGTPLSVNPVPASLVDSIELEQRFSRSWESRSPRAGLPDATGYTRFEKMCILSLHDALSASAVDPQDPFTGFILSTTKGNVELLEADGGFNPDRLLLSSSAGLISSFFGFRSRPLVVSNACISGIAAVLVARRLILSGRYRHMVVLGADVLSRFIVSGFQSFLSLSPGPCKPFDAAREGLSLGEAAATMVVSADSGDVYVEEGAVTNDANHISGPSRTGDGLYLAIRRALEGNGRPDLISAHGTATIYNDEMESLAIARAGLEEVPVNSIKGFLGHTLGAAGVVESILNIEAMKRNTLIPTLGYSDHGVSKKINVTRKPARKETGSVLKIASGFGGCNAAVLYRRKL